MANWWMINNVNDNEDIVKKWIENGVVTLGFPEIGDPMKYDTKDKLLVRCDEVYSDKTPMMRIQCEGYIWKFAREILKGDKLFAYDSQKREYHIGVVESNYNYDPSGYPDCPNTFKVKWLGKQINEDDMSSELKKSLKSNSCVYMVFGCEAEIGRLLVSSGNVNDIIEKEKRLYNDVIECIKTIIYKMDSSKFDMILKEILTAMEYKVSSHFDNDNKNSYLIISEDKLNFSKNIIRVCILKNSEITSSKNIMDIIDKYTDQISNYLIVSDDPIDKGIMGEIAKKYFIVNMYGRDMVEKLFSNYDKLNDEVKSILSLKKLYI
ncbi:restriction endonuclease [Clostridium felsineum]|uniref:Uncharacterized protein n=1 Tax=Clostridium felsineum TaxID=36839 RepID=A0A1S8MCI9_9CLOT|nr:restriction endonuclease [Clostridium felsineum]MCR3761233.1 restriction endonuclease [Clostridium felsineum]URZ07303.1 hypothetical protein CLROS_026410 [Clostridium felsineum]URZ12334.1 hypothetical protein CROST_030560 [Clostridium felsineum]URZ16996.1 hypothetical protein CLFE_030480 [Clostridium felsineum DSM 794]